MASDLSGDLVLYVAQDGEIGGLRKDSGSKVLSRRLGLKPGQNVIGASFDTAGLSAQGAELAKAEPVLDVLRGIIFDRDSSFLSVKSFAVQALGAIPGQGAASELVKVITAEGMPSEVTKTAGDVLAQRKDDPKEISALLVAALRQSYDFLEDKRPRGIDVLARVAQAVSAKETVPVLAERLLDPSTPTSALKDVVVALTKLGGKDALPPLRNALLVYRADPLFASEPDVLRRAGEGLLALGGEPERRLIQYVSMEPHTLPGLATHFRKVLDERAQPKPAAKPAR
jgi:HEAT repeat protein